MDISNLDANGVVQELVNEGRLPNPTIFDNAVIRKTADAPIVPPAAANNGFDANGWGLGKTTILGGRMSKGIEKIRAQLIAQGANEAASHLPVFFCGAFWLPPDAYKGWGLRDPARYQLPTPDQQAAETITPEQVEQIENNLQHVMNTQFAFSGLGVDNSIFMVWRGENDGRGFTRFNDGSGGSFSPAPPAGAQVSNQWSSHNVWAAPRHYTRKYVNDVNGNPTEQYALIEDGPMFADHAIFDRWWDLRTDENVVRYALSWLVDGFGVSLSKDVNFWRS